MAFLQLLVFCGEVTIFYAHWSCNLWSKKCSLYITIQLNKLGKCSLMLVCHEIGWCHEITALCGYSDCYPHVHNPILSLEYLGQRKSLSDPKSQAAWSKGVATMPRGAAETRGQDPWGHVISEFSYKTMESRLYWSWFLFSIILTCSSQPQGTWTGLSLLCLEGGCWAAAGQLCPGAPWVSLGLDWAALGFSPLRRTSLSLLRYRNPARNQMGAWERPWRSRACSSLGGGSELRCEGRCYG